MSTGTLSVPVHDRRSSRSEVGWTLAELAGAAAVALLIMSALGLLLTKPLAHGGFVRWEGGANRYFAAHRTGFGNGITKIFSNVGNTPAIAAVAVLAFIVLRLTLHRWRESLALAATVIGEVAIFGVTTLLISRPRPPVPRLDGAPPTSSFPSGHTAATTSLYGLLAIIIVTHLTRAYWRALVITVTVLLVLSVAISRVYRGMHYPTDVSGGMLLGCMWLVVTSTLILRGRDHD